MTDVTAGLVRLGVFLMFPRERLKDIWGVEIGMFGGTPEASESMYERPQETHGNVDLRLTRKSLPSLAQKKYVAEEEVLFIVTYDAKGETLVYSQPDGE